MILNSIILNLVFLSSIALVICVKIPSEWIDFVKDRTRLFEVQPTTPEQQTPLTLRTQINNAYVDYITPSVILWDPVVQFPHIHFRCPVCQNNLHRRTWQDAHNSVSYPRIIHGVDKIVLLVSRKYQCDAGHETLSHDARYLSLFPSSYHIPFVLTHRSGITRNCFDLILNLIQEGKKISAVESVLRTQRHELYCQRRLRFIEDITRLSPNNFLDDLSTFPEFKNTLEGSIYPSNDMLTACFLYDFRSKEIYFRTRMAAKTLNENWISMDHTFKSSANIGIYTTIGNEKRWVKQYDCIFIVLNSDAHVLTWKLTRGTSYANVLDVLQELQGRLSGRDQNQCLEEIYVDDCCKSRKQLQHIFGDQVKILLDLFHATQRITNQFSRKHYLYHQVVRSFRLVFRSDSDFGETRTLQTPDPEVIEHNLDTFVKQWSLTKKGEKPILTPAVMKAINNLKVHVRKGCLSNIKPGRGTNRNERLHKHLNNVMTYSKIGVELAYALLTTTMDQRNEKERITQYIADVKIKDQQQRNTVQSVPRFGITGQEQENTVDRTVEEHCQDNPDLEITDDELLHIYQKAERAKTVAENVRKQGGNSLIFNETFVPFMTSATSLYFNREFNTTEQYDVHEQRMQAVAKSWGFEVVDVEGDGNCFFTSTAFALFNILSSANCPDNIMASWDFLGIAVNSSVTEIASILRQLIVNEWISNQDRYQQFVTNDLVAEANLFRQSGVFLGEIGNLMPLAAANVLQFPIIMFSSLESVPVIFITPDNIHDNAPPLYITYNQHGLVHYSATTIDRVGLKTLPDTNNRSSKITRKETICSCGKNKKAGQNSEHCVTKKGQYSSRCPCLKGGMGCSEDCRCKCCGNPFGSKQQGRHTKLSLTRNSRKRARQNMTTQRQQGLELMQGVGEKPKSAWHKLEIQVFESLICELRMRGVEVNEENILTYFNRLAYVVGLTAGITKIIFIKTLSQIKERMAAHDRALKVWLSAYWERQFDRNTK